MRSRNAHLRSHRSPAIAGTDQRSSLPDTPLSVAETERAPNHSPDNHHPLLERLLTIDDVADVLQLSTRQVRRLTASRALPVVRIGRAVRVRPAALAALIGN
jgi:excisionase family DNA binding protein